MKKLTLAAVATAMAIAAIAPAQSNGMNSTSISSGPWMMRKSTGDKTVDRFYFIADRTLNAAETETLRSMFRHMGGYTSYTMQKAILNAIDNNAKNNTGYGSWSNGDWANNNGMSNIQVYDAMNNGLDWREKGVLHTWESGATVSEMEAIGKLVRMGGWANSMWTTSGMNNG